MSEVDVSILDEIEMDPYELAVLTWYFCEVCPKLLVSFGVEDVNFSENIDSRMPGRMMNLLPWAADAKSFGLNRHGIVKVLQSWSAVYRIQGLTTMHREQFAREASAAIGSAAGAGYRREVVEVRKSLSILRTVIKEPGVKERGGQSSAGWDRLVIAYEIDKSRDEVAKGLFFSSEKISWEEARSLARSIAE